MTSEDKYVLSQLTNETGNCGGTFRTHFIRKGEVNHGKQNRIK